MNREIKYFQALNEATDLCMAKDASVYIMGLGVPDPKGIFGTTSGLQQKYGCNRVMDMPTSENGMTGVAIGSALVGMRPAGHGTNCQPGGQVALHVWRPVVCPTRHPDDHWPGMGARASALAKPAELVCPRARLESGDARDGL
jgi:hypothetical protein